jgi:hypothetical protein
MMGGGAFILLKVGRAGRESAKQTEIRLASLLIILQITPRGRTPRAQGRATVVHSQEFPLDMANLSRIVHFVI